MKMSFWLKQYFIEYLSQSLAIFHKDTALHTSNLLFNLKKYIKMQVNTMIWIYGFHLIENTIEVS